MDLVSYLAMLRRRWVVIVVFLAAGVAGGYVMGHHGAKQYQATAQCLVNLPVAANVTEQLAGSQLSSNLVATYAELASSPAVAQQVVKSLHLNESAAAVSGNLSASTQTGTYLINITGKATTPALAQSFANAAARGLVTTVSDLQTGLTDGVTVQLVNSASLPGSPTSPRPKLDLFLGIVLGLLAGLAGAGLIEALDRTVKTTAQVDALMSVPLLGLVPRHRGQRLVAGWPTDSDRSEPYRTLRTSVRFLHPDKPLRTILITSPMAGEGKTTTAVNLAIALGVSGERVVVVDADLRRAKLGGAFGVEPAVGLTSLVLGTATLDEALQDWGQGVTVLASGPLPPNPSEILGSQLINETLATLARRFDVVVIDTAPVLPVADAVTLAPQVDGVVLVFRHGKTLRHAAAEADRRLTAVGGRVVGYTLNGIPGREVRDYYATYRYDNRVQVESLEHS